MKCSFALPSFSVFIFVGVTVVLESETILSNAPSTGSVNEPITPGEPVELKLFVDDQYLESVEGASLKIVPDSNTTITPTKIKTENDGIAKLHFTEHPRAPTNSLKIYATSEA